ncbi:hypothetical protein ACRALDRAFT_1042925 [Sodiomyces alcalophilus JCM 7366]|uniref:uncharacterized protein n=1 Tax=Sodiomyces alcalophilus JCM 7366 TaxID=591952 RepID=UPI0039B67C37
MSHREKDIEKSSNYEYDAGAKPEGELNGTTGTEFEPIRTHEADSLSRPHSRSLSRRGSADQSIKHSVSRTRSQNGYSCDDYPPEDDGGQNPLPDAADPARADKDPFEVAFDGGDADPMCPRSMSKARKWIIVIIVSLGSFCVTAASSIYSSTYAQMNAEFGTSRIVATLGLSLFVLGISFGPMLLSPLSEFYGRRPIYIIAWSMYLIWTVVSAVSKNIETMLVSRFFTGLSGSAFLAVSGGTVGDLFNRQELQAPMIIWSLTPFCGPALGPTIGGFINYFTHWRWTYYVLIIWDFVMLVAIACLVPETYHPVVLRNKARKIRKETGDDRWKAPMENTNKSIPRTIGLSLLRPFQLLFHEMMVLNLCVLTAILLGVLYLFFGAFPLVFTNTHGFNLWQVGLTFNGMIVGMVIAAASDPVWQRIRDGLVARLERESGTQGGSEPEFRLPPVICGSVLVTIGLFMFGWTLFPWVHWIAPIIGSAVFGAGTLLVFSGVFTFLVDAYPMYAASALAANAFTRCLFAAAFPLFGNQMYEALGYPWATSVLAFATLAMLPFPYIFFKYGKRIRGQSRFAVG